MGFPLLIIGIISVIGILIGFIKNDRKFLKISLIVLVVVVILWIIGCILYTFFV